MQTTSGHSTISVYEVKISWTRLVYTKDILSLRLKYPGVRIYCDTGTVTPVSGLNILLLEYRCSGTFYPLKFLSGGIVYSNPPPDRISRWILSGRKIFYSILTHSCQLFRMGLRDKKHIHIDHTHIDHTLLTHRNYCLYIIYVCC